MKKLSFLILILFFTFPVFAQFQTYEVENVPYFSFNVANHIDFFNVDKEKFPLSFNSDAVFVSKYFKGQTGFAFRTGQADLMMNLLGQYHFSNGVNLGGIIVGNYKFYYDLALEGTFGLMAFVDYNTKSQNFWKFSFSLGLGNQFTQIQYKKNGSTHWTDREFTRVMFLDLFVLKKIAEKHNAFFQFHSFQNYYFNYNLCPNLTLGYFCDITKTWRAGISLDVQYITYFTNYGRMKDFGITLSGSYRLPLGGWK